MNKLLKRTIRLLFAGPLLAATVHADNLSPDVNNPSLGEGTTGLDSAISNATQGQFSGFAAAAGVIARTAVQATADAPEVFPDLPAEFPQNGTLRLRRSTLGATFSAAIPDYFIGQIVATPVKIFTEEGSGNTRPLRREPVRKDEANFVYRMENGGANQNFVPGNTVDERFFYSPHAVRRVKSVVGEDFEVIGDENDVLKEGFVYASESGVLNLYFRTENPIALTGTNQPIYGLVSRRVFIASGSIQTPRRIFWTEVPFAAPSISLASTEVQEVRFAFTLEVPPSVDRADAFIPDPNNPPEANEFVETRTIWHNLAQKKISAMNVEGRILIELLAEQRSTNGPVRRRQIGVEVVDIIKDAIPYQVDVPLGERLYPLRPDQDGQQSYPLPKGEINRQVAQERITENLEEFSPSLVLNLPTNAGEGFFTGQFTVDGKLAYYAQRVTETPADVLIYWQEKGLGNLTWPRFLNRYEQFWPDDIEDYAVNIRPADINLRAGTLPIFDETAAFELVHNDGVNGQARINNTRGLQVDLDASDPVNRSLILLRANGRFWYVRVESVLDSYLNQTAAAGRYDPFYIDKDTEDQTLTAMVGNRLEPPAGADSVAAYVDLAKGDAIDESAYIDPFSVGVPEAEKGAVIPVNAAPRKGDSSSNLNDKLEVWWFEKRNPPAGLGLDFSPIYFPSYFTKYQLAWPTDATPIVLAEGAGSGDLNPLAGAGQIYVQNDPAKIGYNPNEEHALLTANRAYALRDDLNITETTSSPYVLVQYTAEDERPAMEIFRIFREDATYTFDYVATAGVKLGSPAPVSFLPIPLLPDGTSRNTEVTPTTVDPPLMIPAENAPDFVASYEQFLFEDRKGEKWVYRGPHDPDSLTPATRPKIGLKYYYPTLEGFAFPSDADGTDQAPALGTHTPFLRNPDGLGGFAGSRWDGENGANSVAITVNYTPYWPDRVPNESEREEVPRMQFGESLVKAKFGLPGLNGASSAEILYQQSIAADVTTETVSAQLLDPTRRKVYLLSETTLDKVPSSIQTSSRNGRVYFEGLPPHLEARFYFDPNIGTDGGLVLQGEFVDEIAGEDYLLLNLLSAEEITLLKNLAVNETNMAPWEAAIDGLNTDLETFAFDTTLTVAELGPDVEATGSYVVNQQKTTNVGVSAPAVISNSDIAVDSYALSASGGGNGYLTLVLGNGKAFTDPGDPVQMSILKVGDDLYTGEVKPLTAANPLSEIVTAQFTGDFAGKPEDYEYQWYYSPPNDGQPPINFPDEAGVTWLRFGNDDTGPRMIFGGLNPLIALSDNYIVFRYRPKEGTHFLRPTGSDFDDTEGWSDWTQPKLLEGWIKRVLAGINPFNQRITDFFNNPINTDVSILTQAGGRWEGDLPLTLESVGEAGLIEIYETLLRRAIKFTIDGAPATDYGPANDALLLAAGYLSDLYLAIGNDAFADASNPLIALDVDPSRLLQQQGLPSSIGTTIQSTATSRFAFEGQVPKLIDEELVLLRGRDDFLTPGVRTSPVYNRFYWNFTRGVDAGEVIYALNYNIKEKSGDDADGKIDAVDAARQYPQGHGDAYGHYLTSLTNYYRLLSDNEFTWTPRVEAVNILGQPVTVDYLDERRLARSAAALGRTASRILDLERRRLSGNPNEGWGDLRESRTNPRTGVTRHWGVEQWASRAGQGTYLHWMMVNALVPEEDTVHEGLQKIDRDSVPELVELTSLGGAIQSHLDSANNRTNSLGLAENSLLFDLSPSEMAEGESHFDQVLARAKLALKNLSVAHARTVETNSLLRSVENQADDYNFTVAQEEIALTNRLLDVYGLPYGGDVGPGKTYPQDYSGPDFFRFMYITRPYVYPRDAVFGSGVDDKITWNLPVRNTDFQNRIAQIDNLLHGDVGFVAPSYNPIDPNSQAPAVDPRGLTTLSYSLNLNDGPYQFADPALGKRPFTGAAQEALAQVMTAEENLYLKLRTLSFAQKKFDIAAKTFKDNVSDKNAIIVIEDVFNISKKTADKVIAGVELSQEISGSVEKTIFEIIDSVKESLPQTVGFSNDVLAPARGALLAARVAGNTALTASQITQKVVKFGVSVGFTIAEIAKTISTRTINENAGIRKASLDLQTTYKGVFSGLRDIDLARIEYERAVEAYRNVLVDGDTILAERETFRKRAASVIQGSRVRDVAFRSFRTESLEQYKILFDQAARYTFLAAKAYDYETGLLGSDQGREFTAKIAQTRALGLVSADGEPQFAGASAGDPGLSSLLAQLEQDWNVAKGRLGINNPDQYGTTVSLRREFFELPLKEDGSDENHDAWKDALRSSLVADLRTDSDIAAHALPNENPDNIAQPGFVISFPTTIEDGKNIFGKELRAGDSAFSSTSFSTKIKSVGVVFEGYQGIDPCVVCNFGTPEEPSHEHQHALSATPYVYLIPVGSDFMRTPPINGEPSHTRNWLVHDHAMPLPFDIGGNGVPGNAIWNSSTSLTEQFFVPRRHQAFRAFDETELFAQPLADEFTNSRLIGRSVWNSEWKLVIPAQALLANPDEGIERFIESVRDVKLFFRTYSHSGN